MPKLLNITTMFGLCLFYVSGEFEDHSRLFYSLHTPPSVWPHLFCGAGHEKRRGEQMKWSLACRLYIGSFVFHVHSYQDQFIQPGWAECVLFSLGLHFVCLYCFNLFVCPHPFVFP